MTTVHNNIKNCLEVAEKKQAAQKWFDEFIAKLNGEYVSPLELATAAWIAAIELIQTKEPDAVWYGTYNDLLNKLPFGEVIECGSPEVGSNFEQKLRVEFYRIGDKE